MPFTGRPHRIGVPSTPLQGVSPWSVPLGVWGGTPARLHASLVVVLVLAAGVCLKPTLGWSLAPLVVAAYLFSVLAHEAAHVTAALRCRQHTSRGTILLGPVGGIGYAALPYRPEERVFVAMAGPLANLLIVVVSCFVLVIGGGAEGVALLTEALSNPGGVVVNGAPGAATPAAMLACAMIIVNWPLFLVNLLPAAPFDGGVALTSWFTPHIGERNATLVVQLIGGSVAFGLLSIASLLGVVGDMAPVFSLVLAGLAVVVAFGAFGGGHRSDTDRPNLFHEGLQDAPTDTYDAWYDDDLLPSAAPEGSPHGRVSAEDFDEAWDEGRVDDILAKLHVAGMEGLTPDERDVLEQASDRYRRRGDSDR